MINRNYSTQFVDVEHRDNNRIQIMRLRDVTRKAVDDYIEIVNREIIRKEDSLLLSVQDFTQLGRSITPYFIGKITELSKEGARPDLYGRIAIVTKLDVFRFVFNPVAKIITRVNNKVEVGFSPKLREQSNGFPTINNNQKPDKSSLIQTDTFHPTQQSWYQSSLPFPRFLC